MTEKRRQFPKEFRRDAVKLARSSDRSVREVADELGISDSSLNRWIKQFAVDKGEKEGLTTEERDELRQLRKEVRELRTEKEILKKAAAYFAKESK